MSCKSIQRIARTGNRMAMAVLLAAVIPADGPAQAADPCSGVEQQLTDAGKREYAQLVAKSLNAKVKPSQVEIDKLLESGSWSAVYASTPVSDDGVLFFETQGDTRKFKDVWGGWADPSERPDLIKWAKKLGAPDALARCFANMVTDHG